MIHKPNFVKHLPRNDYISRRVFTRGGKSFRMLIADTNDVLKLVFADYLYYFVVPAVIREAKSNLALELLCLIGFRVCINCLTNEVACRDSSYGFQL